MGLLTTKDPTFDERGQRIPHKGGTPAKALVIPQSEVTADLARGRDDPDFWAWRFLGIRLNRGQRRWLRMAAMRSLRDGWSAAFLTTVVSAGNRAGKTLGLAILVAHHCFYKLGIRPPKAGDRDDAERWARAPYNWYHVAPQQAIAELVYNELVRVFDGSHPAQVDRETGHSRGCPLTQMWPGVVQTDKKYRGEYLWIRFHHGVGGAEVHFRTTDEKAKALLGLDANGISIDEAAFELYLDTIRHEVLNTRRLSTGGPLHAISTPTQGYNAFADWWEEGNPENPRRDPTVIALRLSTRDNVGYGIDEDAFLDLLRQVPDYLVPQNIDGEFIEAEGAYFHAPTVEACFDPDMEGEESPVAGHRYVQGADLGISYDASWGLTLDITTKPWRGVRVRKRAGRQSLPSVVNMVREGHLLYSQGAICTTVIDDTGMGGKVYRQELMVIRPLRTFDFAGTKAKKLNLLANLKAVIDRGDLRLPRTGIWGQVRRQLLGYRLDDKKIEQDAVMTLAMAVWHASRNADNPLEDPTFSYYGSD